MYSVTSLGTECTLQFDFYSAAGNPPTWPKVIVFAFKRIRNESPVEGLCMSSLIWEMVAYEKSDHGESKVGVHSLYSLQNASANPM